MSIINWRDTRGLDTLVQDSKEKRSRYLPEGKDFIPIYGLVKYRTRDIRSKRMFPSLPSLPICAYNSSLITVSLGLSKYLMK